MTGPEHYRKAEELIETREFWEAQVHADLAKVAAIVATGRNERSHNFWLALK